MIDTSHLIKDKATWKICEAARLGLDSIYLSFQSIHEAVEAFRSGKKQGIYEQIEKWSSHAYRFTLSEKVLEDYRKDILPNLPCYWWVDRQPWMRED